MTALSPFRFTRSLRAWGSALLVVSSAVLLSSCGGGGSEGAPLNPAPIVTTPPPPALVVSPPSATVYANTPTTLTITGGTPPYVAFTSDNLILPVTQNVAGAFLNLVPKNVVSDTSVSITIRDSGATSQQTVTAPILVKVSPLALANIEVVGLVIPSACGDKIVCAGENARVTVKLVDALGATMQGRQVRFDAVQGQFNFVLDDATNVLARSQTVTSDINGLAQVRIRVDSNAISAYGLIRATDTASGNRIDGSFLVSQVTAKIPDLSVVPSKVSISAFYNNECTSGFDSYFYIFGGTPPYRVSTSMPSAFTVGNGTPATAILRETTVASAGGYFIAKTAGGCVDPAQIVISDAKLNSVTVDATNKAGSVTPPVAPPPPTLILTPGGINLQVVPTAAAFCTGNFTARYTISGGTAPYRVTVSRPDLVTLTRPDEQTIFLRPIVGTPDSNPDPLIDNGTYLPIPKATSMNITVTDFNNNTVVSQFSCN